METSSNKRLTTEKTRFDTQNILIEETCNLYIETEEALILLDCILNEHFKFPVGYIQENPEVFALTYNQIRAKISAVYNALHSVCTEYDFIHNQHSERTRHFIERYKRLTTSFMASKISQ